MDAPILWLSLLMFFAWFIPVAWFLIKQDAYKAVMVTALWFVVAMLASEIYP